MGNDGQNGEIKLKEGNKKTSIVRLHCLRGALTLYLGGLLGPSDM